MVFIDIFVDIDGGYIHEQSELTYTETPNIVMEICSFKKLNTTIKSNSIVNLQLHLPRNQCSMGKMLIEQDTAFCSCYKKYEWVTFVWANQRL